MLTRTLYKKSVRAFSSGFSKFDPFDCLKFEETLTEEEQMIQESARKFTEEQLLPRVVEGTRKEYFDPQIMREYGAQGFLGATLKDYGLPGISATAYGLIAREVE